MTNQQEISQSNVAAPGASPMLSPLMKQALIAIIPGVLGSVFGAFIAVNTIETDLTHLSANVERNTAALTSAVARISAHDATLAEYKVEGEHNRGRLVDVEEWQTNQGRRIREFYENQWPKVEATLVSVAALQKEIDALRRDLKGVRR